MVTGTMRARVLDGMQLCNFFAAAVFNNRLINNRYIIDRYIGSRQKDAGRTLHEQSVSGHSAPYQTTD
jgi:hypothetical protein